MWVQVAQQLPDDTTVTRWRAQGGGAWQLELSDNTQQAIVAISAFAPVTTMPMPYMVTINAES
jgi:hypothetical protein